MATIGIRELKTGASDIMRRSERGETFVVTRRGRPISVLLPLDDDLEDIILANAPRFVRLYARGWTEYQRGQTVEWRALKRELDGTAKKGRRSVLARRAR